MTNKINIAIVEDFMRFRKGLIMAFSPYLDEINVLFEAENGQDMIAKMTSAGIPDVILMDLQMPVMDGIESTKWLNINFPDTKIIILTTHTDERFISYMLEIGAHGYLFKNTEPANIKSSIVEVFNKGFTVNFMIEGILKRSQRKPGDPPPAL